MPAVASDIDTVSAKGEDDKLQDETVTKCPFAHAKHTGDAASDSGIETNGNEQNGKIKARGVSLAKISYTFAKISNKNLIDKSKHLIKIPKICKQF